jgi:hypothetical protein
MILTVDLQIMTWIWTWKLLHPLTEDAVVLPVTSVTLVVL